MPSTSNEGVCKSNSVPVGRAKIRSRKKKQESDAKVGNIICNIDIKDAERKRDLVDGTEGGGRVEMRAWGHAVDTSAQEDASKEGVCADACESRHKELFDRQIGKNLRMISRHLRRNTPEVFGHVKLYADVSKIHGIGIFAGTDIPAGIRIIEYVGELIGKKVADKRERFYKENGILSVYLFKILDDLIVDATLKGNLASSDEHDDTRLPCYCGHEVCTRFMG
ncbi:UNVERIFIED_CONTAM: hypothetical protein PYX00_011329 [Menopon gallinae]|uniref:[histone H3]-lysine(4) N-trimethyltransferase n=1 Tax=Menopon gallinae TaxID=328185 RepID=A0AAW2H7E9_9NEOP